MLLSWYCAAPLLMSTFPTAPEGSMNGPPGASLLPFLRWSSRDYRLINSLPPWRPDSPRRVWRFSPGSVAVWSTAPPPWLRAVSQPTVLIRCLAHTSVVLWGQDNWEKKRWGAYSLILYLFVVVVGYFFSCLIRLSINHSIKSIG